MELIDLPVQLYLHEVTGATPLARCLSLKAAN